MTTGITDEFIALYDEMADQLFRHCFFKLSNRELALDLVQETFARTWEYIASGKEVKNIKGFLFKVANNLIIDEYRKKKAVSLETLQEQTGFDAPVNEHKKTIFSVEVDTVLTHINKLDSKYKDVILMRYVNDYSPKEIAKILGESENAVSVRINRGLKKVQEMLNLSPQ
ncbi:MAG: polymerase sigma factor, sigma-70 family [Candidatus Paceibacter sp.]|nr:polymerase sigma factor, sigma-70 family [Candidatus Paceibacter sp.]